MNLNRWGKPATSKAHRLSVFKCQQQQHTTEAAAHGHCDLASQSTGGTQNQRTLFGKSLFQSVQRSVNSDGPSTHRLESRISIHFNLDFSMFQLTHKLVHQFVENHGDAHYLLKFTRAIVLSTRMFSTQERCGISQRVDYKRMLLLELM